MRQQIRALESRMLQRHWWRILIVNPEQHKQVTRKTAQSELDEQPPAEFGLEGLFNLSLDLLGIAGRDGYFKRVNPAFEKTLGYTIEELLARKYQGHLDHRADKYLGYIMEGATRMQQLINDLLEFSRVGTHGKNLQGTDTEVILSQVLADLKIAVAESQTVVTHDPLATLMEDEIQLIQLFQNLIGNAIKFRRDKPPRVHVTAQQKNKEWVFEVRDNGIGMESKFFERIFTIFQRLHSRTEYPGTGIGLAVCKKIVERHRGQIWVKSTLGVGTTFYFSIPQKRQ